MLGVFESGRKTFLVSYVGGSSSKIGSNVQSHLIWQICLHVAAHVGILLSIFTSLNQYIRRNVSRSMLRSTNLCIGKVSLMNAFHWHHEEGIWSSYCLDRSMSTEHAYFWCNKWRDVTKYGIFPATKISICSISPLISEVEKMICMPMKTSLIPTSVTILKSLQIVWKGM